MENELMQILREMREDVPYDSCSVQELRENRLVIIGGVGFAELDVIIGESFEIDNIEIPNGEVIYRRRPLIVRDVESYRAFRRGLHVGSGIRSWLGVPLMNDDHIIGMLALDKTEAGFYQTHHSRAAMEHAARIAELLDRDESVPSAECG
jgi:signal transduction protein with GAF and PtsI domain